MHSSWQTSRGCTGTPWASMSSRALTINIIIIIIIMIMNMFMFMSMFMIRVIMSVIMIIMISMFTIIIIVIVIVSMIRRGPWRGSRGTAARPWSSPPGIADWSPSMYTYLSVFLLLLSLLSWLLLLVVVVIGSSSSSSLRVAMAKADHVTVVRLAPGDIQALVRVGGPPIIMNISYD